MHDEYVKLVQEKRKRAEERERERLAGLQDAKGRLTGPTSAKLVDMSRPVVELH